MIEESRKQKEASFHDKIRNIELEKNSKMYEELAIRRRFYCINRKSDDFFKNFIKRNCAGKKILDYCCGEGDITFFLSESGADAVGIDISPVSIEHALKKAKSKNLERKISFRVMDGENLEFENDSFDLIVCSGVLHHLDIEKAYKELSRVIKPDGKIICNEPLIHNPVFQLYRKLTPHLRTEWEVEHILKRKDIKLAEKYFSRVETKFFHLISFAAVPFLNFPGFSAMLAVLEALDSIILKIPGLKWWAWQAIFILSEPKK